VTGVADRPLRVARPLGRVDLEAAEAAARDLLAALGADPADEDLAGTPRRVAAAYAELLTPVPFTPTTVANHEGYDGLVVARAIPFSSLCRHHLLPFTGVAHVGYLPGDRILGLSKLARGRTVTSALRGRIRDDPRTRAEFLALATTMRG
jgi:GTP cyclohydrolase I